MDATKVTPPSRPPIDKELLSLFNDYRNNIGSQFSTEAAFLTLAHVIRNKSFGVDLSDIEAKIDRLQKEY